MPGPTCLHGEHSLSNDRNSYSYLDIGQQRSVDQSYDNLTLFVYITCRIVVGNVSPILTDMTCMIKYVIKRHERGFAALLGYMF